MIIYINFNVFQLTDEAYENHFKSTILKLSL